jgi:hypothetical protein
LSNWNVFCFFTLNPDTVCLCYTVTLLKAGIRSFYFYFLVRYHRIFSYQINDWFTEWANNDSKLYITLNISPDTQIPFLTLFIFSWPACSCLFCTLV